jgi:quercetin dioxygenase-like cupin family protein
MHAGPVVAYIVEGEIENEVEPDPPAVYKAGGFFYEPAMHVHKVIRNLSTTAPAKLIIFQAGLTRVPASSIKMLQTEPTKLLQYQLQVPLPSTVNQELRLHRLTLPPGTRSDALAHSGPGVVHVLEGTITTSSPSAQPRTYSAGDVFLEPANRAGLTVRNANDREPAKLLLYHVSEQVK